MVNIKYLTLSVSTYKMVKHTQAICQQQTTNCLSVFGHFVELMLKCLMLSISYYCSCKAWFSCKYWIIDSLWWIISIHFESMTVSWSIFFKKKKTFDHNIIMKKVNWFKNRRSTEKVKGFSTFHRSVNFDRLPDFSIF